MSILIFALFALLFEHVNASDVLTDHAHTGSVWTNFIGGGTLFSYLTDDNLERSDDGCSSGIALSKPFRYFETWQSDIYVCTNGLLSFTSAFVSKTPTQFPVDDVTIVAPFWSDVDIRYHGKVYYGPASITRLGEITDALKRVQLYSDVTVTWAYIVTWLDVPAYPGQGQEKNTFQAVLASDGDSSFVIFNYHSIQWTSATAGDYAHAQVGLNSGNRKDYYQSEWSASQLVVNLLSASNADVAGRFVFKVGSTVDVPPITVINKAADEMSSQSLVTNEISQKYDTDEAKSRVKRQYSCWNWEHSTNLNSVWGLIPSPGQESRPNTFYFGQLGDDVNGCADLCAAESNCYSYTLHMTAFGGGWAGQCYGRSNFQDTRVNENNINSGYKVECVTLPCESNPCQNGASCFDGSGNGYSCGCLPGYEGTNCETNTNECASTPCQNGAQCNDAINYFTCSCVAGYEGTLCNVNIDECADVTCQNTGTCVDGVNMYTCNCRDGYRGTHCEEDIDECASNPCQNAAPCANLVNMYTCTCDPGYTGTDCETDINECASTPCENGATCTDEVNGYTCTCVPGYTTRHCSYEVIECSSDPCQHGATCVDRVNQYTCTCAPGYTGIHCETEIDECSSNPCLYGGTCHDEVNYYTCECVDGYIGIHCETNFDECGSNPCQHGASCNDWINHYICDCASGYTGVICETEIDECLSIPCQFNGTCTDEIAFYWCTCADGYTGIHCETNIDECASDPCVNGATCNDHVNEYSCTCPAGYTGVLCETDIDDCTIPDEPCLNGGVCTDWVDNFHCECPDRTVGYTCVTDPCLPNPCFYSAYCTVGNYTEDQRYGNYSETCNCVPNFDGSHCEYGPCDTFPIENNDEPYCLNGGRCSNHIVGQGFGAHGEAWCNCTDTGYEGDRCDEDDSAGSSNAQSGNKNNDDEQKQSGVGQMVADNPGAAIGVAAALLVILIVLIVILIKKKRKKEEVNKEELREEARKKQEHERRVLAAQEAERHTTWTGIGGQQSSPVSPSNMDDFLIK